MTLSDVTERFEYIADDLIIMKERDMLTAKGREYIDKIVDRLMKLKENIIEENCEKE